MISKQTFRFLKELKNNNRDWFNANKEKYQAANAVMSGDFAKRCTEVFKALYPFDRFLNEAIL